MNIAFVASGLYQIVNVLALVDTIKKELISKENNIYFDIYIEKSFKQVELYGNRLSDLQLFNRVVYFDIVIKNENYFHKIKNTYNPGNRLNLMTHIDGIDSIKYDIIFCHWISSFERSLIYNNTEAKIYYYDEGTASYSIDSTFSTLSWKHKLANSLLGNNYKRLYPERLYVHNVEFCRSRIVKDIRPLKFPVTELFHRQVEKLLKCGATDLYQRYKYIYLTQTFDCNQESTVYQEEENVLGIFVKNQINPLLRIHPRQLETNIYKKYNIDETESLWEMICYNQIDSSKVLIARCSSTQFMPKLLYNKEPYLIFTYLLFPTLLADTGITAVKELIKNIKNFYDDKDKIFVPEDLQEFSKILNVLESNRSTSKGSNNNGK